MGRLSNKHQAAESAGLVFMKLLVARVNSIAAIHIVLVSIACLAPPVPLCVGRVRQTTLKSVMSVRVLVM